MFVSKWFAMIGVELVGDPAPLDGLLERLMEGVAVGAQVIGTVSNQT
jgi:hypothetical protein